MITVYGKPDCVRCRQTCHGLDRWEKHYHYVDVQRDTEAEQHLRSLGLAELPVVEAGEERFTGFRPDRLKQL